MDLSQLQQTLQGATTDPSQWSPPFCGDIPLRIHYNGQWSYAGSPIQRQALVTLFASVLWQENDEFFLLTPAEKVRIQVDDVPFVITQWRRESEYIVLTTQTEQQLVLSPDNPLELRQDPVQQLELPYCRVHRNLYGRLHQNVFYQLAEEAELVQQGEEEHLMLTSGEHQFSLGRV